MIAFALEKVLTFPADIGPQESSGRLHVWSTVESLRGSLGVKRYLSREDPGRGAGCVQPWFGSWSPERFSLLPVDSSRGPGQREDRGGDSAVAGVDAAEGSRARGSPWACCSLPSEPRGLPAAVRTALQAGPEGTFIFSRDSRRVGSC